MIPKPPKDEEGDYPYQVPWFGLFLTGLVAVLITVSLVVGVKVGWVSHPTNKAQPAAATEAPLYSQTSNPQYSLELLFRHGHCYTYRLHGYALGDRLVTECLDGGPE